MLRPANRQKIKIKHSVYKQCISYSVKFLNSKLEELEEKLASNFRIREKMGTVLNSKVVTYCTITELSRLIGNIGFTINKKTEKSITKLE